jgi:ABC-type transporter Mla MlaB component
VAVPDEPPPRPRVPRRTGAGRCVEVTFAGAIQPGMIPSLCIDVGRLVTDTAADRLVCELSGLTQADLATVDALCRLRVTVRRLGCEIALRGAPPDLDALLAFVGLDGVLHDDDGSASRIGVSGEPAGSGLGAGRQAEQREEAGRVQEERDASDAPILDVEDLQGPGLEGAIRAARLVLPEPGGSVGHHRDEP